MPHTLVVGLGAACELAAQEMDVSDNCDRRVGVWCGVQGEGVVCRVRL